MITREQITDFCLKKAYKPLTGSELASALEVGEAESDEFLALLSEMEAGGALVKTRFERYAAPERLNLVVGRLQGHPKGFGFIIPDNRDLGDLYIGRENLNGAWHGDRVIARPGSRMEDPRWGVGDGRRVEGEIIRILKRANPRVVGTYQRAHFFGFVKPDERRLPDDVFIPSGADGGAGDGEKVVVEIRLWPDGRRNAEGRVVEVLGRLGEPGVDITSIVRRYGLPETFPEEIMAEAERIPDQIRPDDLKGREDLRGLPIVTIDGEDAKDLDDAVSVERAGDLWRLGVHIADVSYYVSEGSALDREARERGTSVYLVDRVIPMLPPRLSNGLCSLNPQVDRLTMTVFIDLDERGRVANHRFTPSIIRTAERMTYTNVTRILVDGDRAATARYEPLVPLFRQMEALCRILREKRMRRGSIDFDLAEEKVILDEVGRPKEIRPAVRTIADQIIEEFMIAANEAVAEHFCHLEVPFLYRVHQEPDAEKLYALNEFLTNFGYRLKGLGNIHPKAIQEIAQKVAGKREEHLINTVMLRSLKQARYCEENLGHFGLAADYYTHFTSPIRRYPDLMIHRVMREVLEHGRVRPDRLSRWTAAVPAIAEHSSDMERRADEAERETVDLKKAEFIAEHVGEVFPGIISGVTAYGLYVELDNTVEGLVHVSAMAGDYYIYNEKQYALIGERTRRVYRLGDAVEVQVVGVKVEGGQVDLVLVDRSNPRGREPAVRGTGAEAGRRAGDHVRGTGREGRPGRPPGRKGSSKSGASPGSKKRS